MKNKNKKIQKIIASSLLLLVMLPTFVSAQSLLGGLDTVPVNDGSLNSKFGFDQGALGGTVGTIVKIADQINKIKAGLSSVCAKTIEALGTATDVSDYISKAQNNPAFWQQILGGSAVEATTITVQIQFLNATFACVKNFNESLKDVKPGTFEESQNLQKLITHYGDIQTQLSGKIESLNARASASWKDVLKAVMVKMILTLNKNLTTELVNGLVQKYRIEDYLAYGDAVATQLYSMKYINENYSGDARTQMMLRSLVQSQKFPEKAATAMTFANQMAQEQLNKSCDGVKDIESSDTESYLRCISAYGQAETSPAYQYMQALDKTSVVLAAAKNSTAQEIATSNGFAPPRDCSGSVAAQQQIDSSYDQAVSDLETAKRTTELLLDAYTKNPTPAQEAEYNKAFAAEQIAEDKLNNLSKNTKTPVIDICKAITAPSNFVSDQINNFLKQHLDQASQLKSDNLPFYANFLSDVASNFLTNLIVGGKSTGQVFKEAGYQALGGTIVALSDAQKQAAKNTTGPITPGKITEGYVKIYAREVVNSDLTGDNTTTLSAGKNYAIVVDFKDLVSTGDANYTPVRMVVSGVAGGPLNFDISSAELNSGTVTFDVSNATKSFTVKVLLYSKLAGTPENLIRAEGWSQNFGVGVVQGVSTVSFYPRGTFAPRGN